MGHFKPYPEQLFMTKHLLFLSNQFTDKFVEEELILYKKTYISSLIVIIRAFFMNYMKLWWS